ncbi:hypothetical protein AACH06_25165 [Ideonella sp. DXS29W]|uniref:Uncharacterized protein n=1 Tax=Ideonella lacteola TaxID=2984193 RepID=A0ABU9BWJ6_9BURK
MDEIRVAAQPTAKRFELRFQSLFNQGRAMVFPCDEQGQVDIDALSERARENYLYARAVIGFEFATPAVTPDYSH